MATVHGYMPVDYPDPTVRRRRRGYARKRAEEFAYPPSALSVRQTNFYQNLMLLAIAVGSPELPVDFETDDGEAWYLDRGCLSLAQHSGFIESLRNNGDGVVSTVRIAWDITGNRTAGNILGRS